MQYYIAIVRDYFAGQDNLMGVELETNRDNYDTAVFDTVEDARARVTELDAEPYYTLSGEAGRPNYYIIDDACLDWLQSDDYSQYDWDRYDGRVDDEGNADCLSDDFYRFGAAECERYVREHAIM